MGTLYESCNNQIPDAIDAYTRALELDPNNAQIKQRLNALKQSQSGQKGNAPASGDSLPKIAPVSVAPSDSSSPNVNAPTVLRPSAGISGNITSSQQIQRLSVPALPLLDVGKPNSNITPIPKMDAGKPSSPPDSSQKPSQA